MTKEETPEFKPKMRVQCLTEEGITISDRLVDQYTELNIGPKVSHNGPIKLEIILTNQEEVEKFTTYINKLVGNLPLAKVAGKRGRPESAQVDFNSPREELLEDIKALAAHTDNQDTVINYLREKLGFVFLLTEDLLTYFPDFPFLKKDIGDKTHNGQYPDSLQWMIRRIKAGKDPKTDKYDPQIIFGFEIMNRSSNRVVPYLYKERKDRIKASVPKKNAISFNNTELTKFPKYMNEEERLKFSTEMRQLLLNESKKPSKFFIRWFPDVVFPTAIKEAITATLSR